jgi:hypothetical protein
MKIANVILKKYITIRENGGWDNWGMIEIEKYPCNDDNVGRARKRYCNEVINANMNSVKPYIKEDEKQKINKEYKVFIMN